MRHVVRGLVGDASVFQICFTSKAYLVNSFKKSYGSIDIFFWKDTGLSVIHESTGKYF